jgi:hypothetical protein
MKPGRLTLSETTTLNLHLQLCEEQVVYWVMEWPKDGFAIARGLKQVREELAHKA